MRVAFTLTEVLLAVVIVGVLAALVLPAVVTHFQEKGFAQAYVRETKTIQSAIEGLAVNENKASFFETMMYKDAEPENYSDTAEYFLKKYLRVSKICGDNNGDCFAKTYYSYENHDKKVYEPEYKGSCAVLKNGASICLTPQVGASPIVGLIDINGPKGPNVLGKDMRAFSIAAETRLGHRSDTEAVLDYEFDPIKEKEDPCAGKTCGCGDLPPCDPCEGKTCGCGSLPPCETPCSSNPNEWDLSCCEKNSGSINSPEHHCCSYAALKNTASCKPSPVYVDIDYTCDLQAFNANCSMAYARYNVNCTLDVKTVKGNRPEGAELRMEFEDSSDNNNIIECSSSLPGSSGWNCFGIYHQGNLSPYGASQPYLLLNAQAPKVTVYDSAEGGHVIGRAEVYREGVGPVCRGTQVYMRYYGHNLKIEN